MENIIFIICLTVIFMILLWNVKAAPRKTFFKDYFSLEISKGIQGFLAFTIILHHISVWLQSTNSIEGLFVYYYYFGAIVVGFFFFCSGYGLLYSLETKPNYLNGFIKKRVLTVLVPFFICNYIYMISGQISGIRYSTKEIVAAFFGVLLLNSQTWFAVEIMIIYIIFYIIFKYIKNSQKAICVMGICILLLMTYSFFNGRDFITRSGGLWFHGEWWYNTTLLFFIGMLYQKFEKVIIEWFHKHYYLILGLSLTGLVLCAKINAMISAFFINKKNVPTNPIYSIKFGEWMAQFILAVLFITVQILIMMKVKFHNRFLSFLAEYSLEIILINYVYIRLFDCFRITYGLGIYVVLVIIMTILSAVMINKIKLIILEKDKRGRYII